MSFHKIRFWLFLAILSNVIGAVPIAAQEEFTLKLLEVDSSGFPIIRITLMTGDDIGAPVGDLSLLTLRENGVPVTDYSIDDVPAGVDITFVLDANIGFDETDGVEGGLSRREKVRDSVGRFAELYMNSNGLDRVSIVVPSDDGQSAAWLLQDAHEASEVIAAIEGYEPARLRPTPLNDMLVQALQNIQERPGDDRYRAILLFTDSRRLPEQLSYPILTALASDLNVPIYVAILGADADEQEIANAQRLFAPTKATYVHMPEAGDSDRIYAIWQSQGDHLQLSYKSRQRQNGRNQVNISLGPAQVSGEFEIALQAPEVALEQNDFAIQRVGITADSSLADLQPVIQPLPIRVSWPDGLPRILSNATLTGNGLPMSLLGSLPEEATQSFTLSWDIRDLTEGNYDLVLTVTDELGYQGTSTVVPARIMTTWPAAPTAVPAAEAATAGASELPQTTGTARMSSLTTLFFSRTMPGLSGLGGDLAAVFAALLLVFFAAALWRRRTRGNNHQKSDDHLEPVPIDMEHDEEQNSYVARLEPFSGLSLEPVEFIGENITIGRTPGLVDIVIPHPTVGHLHARIRHQNEAYWLFDEGSSEGTYLNYARLGLAPQEIRDGDVVQFGRVSYYFRLQPEGQQVDTPAVVENVPEIAVVLDMDGLMVDTEPLSRQAWDQVLVDLGFEPLSDTIYDNLIGHRLWETSEMIVAHYQLPIEPSELAWRKEVLFAEIRNAGIPVMPGLHELLAALQQRRIAWGVATSSPRHMAEEVLTQIGVLDSCQAIAAGDEVANGKPQPDVFSLAAQRMQVPPQNCLGLEDSVPGCRSASTAGLLTVAIPNSQAMWDDFACADYILTSLLDVVGRLDELLAELRQR